MVARNPIGVFKAVGKKIEKVVFFFDLDKRKRSPASKRISPLGLYWICLEVFLIDWEF